MHYAYYVLSMTFSYVMSLCPPCRAWSISKIYFGPVPNFRQDPAPSDEGLCCTQKKIWEWGGL